MKRKVIFLDRDGVICEEKGYVVNLEQVAIFEYTKECIDRIHELGYLAVVITNQSAVARGMMTEKQLTIINEYIKQRTNVDKIFYCPHYNNGCKCRKPNTGLLETAVSELDIDLTGAYFVGDRASDILTGKNFGIQTVLLQSGYGTDRLEEAVTADYVMKDLREFVDFLKVGAVSGV